MYRTIQNGNKKGKNGFVSLKLTELFIENRNNLRKTN